jgi:hypothetical protein
LLRSGELDAAVPREFPGFPVSPPEGVAHRLPVRELVDDGCVKIATATSRSSKLRGPRKWWHEGGSAFALP